MARLIDDKNLTDEQRIAAIQEATGAGPARAEQMLAQSRGEAPRSDVVIVEDPAVSMTAAVGVAVLSITAGSGIATARPVREEELVEA